MKWNTEVKCIRCANNGHLTKGKIYKIKDGILTTDIGAKYYYKDIDDMNKHSLINYFEGVEMGKSKWNGKVRCIKGFYNEVFKKDRIYKISDGRLSDIPYQFEDLKELNSTYSSQFEEVFDKVKLLLKQGYKFNYDDMRYNIYIFEDYNLLEIRKNDRMQYDIRWGRSLNTTISDIQPILDVLNIEIVEEQPKYKIDIEGEYSEEELEAIKKAGIKFKKVGG